MTWTPITRRDALRPGGMLEAEAGRTAILLHDVAGEIFATAAICPHHAAWLSQGTIDGDCVDCPRHQGRFHIPTGRKVRGPDCPDLRVYEVRVEDGTILVRV